MTEYLSDAELDEIDKAIAEASTDDANAFVHTHHTTMRMLVDEARRSRREPSPYVAAAAVNLDRVRSDPWMADSAVVLAMAKELEELRCRDQLLSERGLLPPTLLVLENIVADRERIRAERRDAHNDLTRSLNENGTLRHALAHGEQRLADMTAERDLLQQRNAALSAALGVEKEINEHHRQARSVDARVALFYRSAALSGEPISLSHADVVAQISGSTPRGKT